MGLARGGGRGGGAELRETAGAGFQAGHGAPGEEACAYLKLSPRQKLLIPQMRPQGFFLKTANHHQGLTNAEGKLSDAITSREERLIPRDQLDLL